MSSFNRLIMLGNLTKDPVLSYTPSNTAVVNIGIATNRNWTGKDGNKSEEVCFIDCVGFGKTAENINKYFQKGNPILIEGRLTLDTWQAQDGSNRSKHKVTIESFQFINSVEKKTTNNNYENTTGYTGADDIPF